MTMAWQPTPPPTGDPAPGTVDRLCGHPLQNAAVRTGAAGVADGGVTDSGVMDSVVRPAGPAVTTAGASGAAWTGGAGVRTAGPASVVRCGGSPGRRGPGAG